ncbi:MAG: EAL domain-containing protein [Gammaproteobacteria bacterium]|nr:EAL domain-containing protein [Gammaproteobacteria bacterium]
MLCVGLMLGASAPAYSAGYNDQFDILYLDDSTNPLTLEQVSKLPKEMFADSTRQLHKPLSLDFSVWYQIVLKDNSGAVTEPITITVDNPTLDSIKFHLLERHIDNKKNTTLLSQKTVGDTQRSATAVDYVVPQFSLFNGFEKQQVMYVHVKTNGASASPIIIESVSSSELRSSAQLMLLGCFVGVVLIMVIYNFFMFRGIGDLSYINYIGYIAFAGLTMSMINGFTYFILPFELASWMNDHLLISHFCGLAFAIRFAIAFLRFQKVKPWFVQLGVFLSRLNFLFAASALFLTEGTLTPVYFASVASVYVYAIILMSKVIGEKLIWVKYYLASWIPLFVGVGVGIAAFNGGIAYNFLTRNAAMFGILSEICIMAIALMDRFRVNELDKDYKTHHDVITGLPNKVALNIVLEKLTANKKHFTLGVFEIDQADAFFAGLGVEKANQLYRELFRNIEEYSEGLSSVYKFGINLHSEEHHVIRINDARFAVVFLGDLTEQTLEYNVNVMQEAVSTLVYINGAAISPSSTVGLVSYPPESFDSQQSQHLLFYANQALYLAKRDKLPALRFEESNENSSLENFELAGELQKAILNDDLQLFHQPQVEMQSGKVIGSELLLRWNHNERGLVDAAKIIAVAEQTGVMNQLTEWVIGRGFEQHSKLLKLGFEHSISINLSVKDLLDNSLLANVLTATVEHNVPPETVIFEIKEDATVDQQSLVKGVTAEFIQQGFKIAIDDFGSGYSNLNQLTLLAPAQVKLDKTFFDLEHGLLNRTVAESIIDLASKLGIEVVAEGVESEASREILQAINCRFAQGYYFAEPMAFLDYMRWLQYKPNSTENSR